MSIDKRSIPECLRDPSKHVYKNGKCIFCGENPLAATGFNRFKMSECSNIECRAILSSIAPVCPHCGTPQRPTVVTRASRSLSIWLFSPRRCGINNFEQVVLVVTTAVGVYIGGYIRSTEASTGHKFDLAEFVTALIVSVLLIPKLFSEPDFSNQDTAFIYRLGLALQKGVFSDLIIQGLSKELAK